MASSLSDYERMREANIERNNLELKRLGLGLNTTPKTAEKKTRKRAPPWVATRRSKRLARSPPDSKSMEKIVVPAVTSQLKAITQRSTPPPPSAKTAKAAKEKHHPAIPGTIEDLRPYEKGAFFALREWKRGRAREMGYNDPCIICHNRTLVEMVRLCPADKEALVGVWGMGRKRLGQHGSLMLGALEPFRQKLLESHAQYSRRKTSGGSSPSRDWLSKRERLELPDCAWDAMRGWCAQERGCQACWRWGPDGKWAVQSQKVLNALQKLGGREAGWRWHPRPTGSAHLHQWWPPQWVCEKEAIENRDLPLGTMAVLEILERRKMENDAKPMNKRKCS